MAAATPSGDRPLGLTMGDPSGIGPEIVVKAVLRRPDTPLVAVGDPGVLADAVKRLGANLKLTATEDLGSVVAAPNSSLS